MIHDFLKYTDDIFLTQVTEELTKGRRFTKTHTCRQRRAGQGGKSWGKA